MRTIYFQKSMSSIRKVFLLILLVGSSLLLRSQTIIINMDTVTAVPGDSVTIPVYAHNFTGVGSFTFYLQYNTSVLQWGRVLHWNPDLLPGVHLGNAANGQVAVVWADINGVNITEGKLFDLRFKFLNNSTTLTFTNQCEITDMMGNPVAGTQFVNGLITRRISVLLHANPPVLCFGDSTQLSFVVQGGLGSYTYNWSSDPPGFTASTENPTVIPGNSTIYNIMVTDGFDTAYSDLLVTVYFFVTPSPVENMIPVNGATNLTLPILFMWTPPANASSYDLFLWKDGDSEPLSPLVANITQINYLLNTFLEYGFTYHWRVTAKNPCLEMPGPIQTFTVRDLPDLIVYSINTPPQVYSGQTINIDFQVKNIGLGSTLTSQWYDAVYLSTDTTLETDVDYYVGSYQNLTYLDSQQAYNQTITFTLPQGISGYYYIIVKTDNSNSVLETNNNNNISHNKDTMLVYLSPVPDLRVAKIIVQNSSFSGQQINITWHVKNNGLANTGNLTWNDRVYFSADTMLNSSAVNLGTFSRTGDLPQDSLYEMTRAVTIPNYIFGRFYFYVVTDVYNQVYEHALENNNTLRSDSISIFLTPPPDLVTTSVIASLDVSNNETVTIQWTVQNQGANPATGHWHDRVYLTNSLTLNTSTAYMLGDVLHHGPLGSDEAYTQSMNVVIPSQITGPYYFIVFSDALLQIFEHTQEENNIKRCSHPTNILPCDLASSALVTPSPAWSGLPYTFSYYSTNHGTGKVIGSWTDKIYVSDLATFDVAAAKLISTRIFHNEIILPNDSVQREFTANLPNGISGQYYLFVVSDFFNTIFEPSHEDNNISRSNDPFTVQLSPWPDLIVTNITVSNDTVTPGFPFNITYTIKNTGVAPVTGLSWKDNLYLSRNPLNFDNITLTLSYKDSLNLLPDSSFSRTVQINLPSWVPSNIYFWWVKADAEDQVYEHTGENNNLLVSSQVFVEPYPPVDLVVTSMNNPTTAFSGTSITANWTVRNDGTVPTLTYYWYDFVYLSVDTTPDPASDIYITYFDNNGYLNPGNSYTRTVNITLPNGITGDYYLYVYTDRNNHNHDPNQANNIGFMRDAGGTPVAIHISLTPPADLTVSSFSCPSIGVTGQPLTVTWTVKNQGTGPTNGNTWYDRIYLSTDFTVDGSDYILGIYTHNGVLQVDSTYSRTEQFFLPSWVSGNYIILIKTDATNMIYEMTNEDNNVANQVINIQLPPPSDLVITQVIPPTEAYTGQNITLTWTVKNQGVNPATGYMKDMVYFSEDTLWDINDPLFGTVQGNISIGPDASINRSYEGIISGISPGEWYVIVRTDVLNNIIESNDNNNIAYSVQKILVTVPELPVNIWVSNTLTDFVPIYYRIEVPSGLAGETMQIRLFGDSIAGANELYVKQGSLPTRTTYDYAYDNPNFGNQEILIPFLAEGTYYLMVYGNTANGNTQSVGLHARILNFQILSVADNSGGNTGEVTLKITGSKFTPTMQVFLVKGENKISGTNYQFVDAAKAYITFNLDGAELGYYGVLATKFCEGMASLDNAFEVIQGAQPDLQVNAYQPSSIRPNGIATIVIEFYNAGNVDLIAPEIEFISIDHAPVSLTVSGLSAGNTSLLLPLRENNGPPLILRPGIGGTLTVYAKASKGLAFIIKLPNYE